MGLGRRDHGLVDGVVDVHIPGGGQGAGETAVLQQCCKTRSLSSVERHGQWIDTLTWQEAVRVTMSPACQTSDADRGGGELVGRKTNLVSQPHILKCSSCTFHAARPSGL